MNKIEIEILKLNHAGCFVRKDAKLDDPAVNYGVISVKDGILTYWTHKAMTEYRMMGLVSLNLMFDKENLILNGYIETIDLKDIYRVLF